MSYELCKEYALKPPIHGIYIPKFRKIYSSGVSYIPHPCIAAMRVKFGMEESTTPNFTFIGVAPDKG